MDKFYGSVLLKPVSNRSYIIIIKRYYPNRDSKLGLPGSTDHMFVYIYLNVWTLVKNWAKQSCIDIYISQGIVSFVTWSPYSLRLYPHIHHPQYIQMYILTAHLYICVLVRANWEVLVACGFVCNQAIVAIRYYFSDNSESSTWTLTQSPKFTIPQLYL